MDELDNRHSGFWRSLVRWLGTVKTPLKMLATDAKNRNLLGRGSFCFNYGLNSAWHGGDQFVALLRWYGSLGCFDSGLQVICIVGSGVSSSS